MLYDLSCPACDFRITDKYSKVPLTPRRMPVCSQCGHRMVNDITSMGRGLTATFAEDRPFVDHHISPDGKPVVITSWEQRRKLMQKYNLEDMGVKRGMPGCWA